jgi:isocitrate dehydrogenase kinase/phosphatase
MAELLTRSTASTSETAFAIAHALLEGFNKHYRLFRQISREAKGRFERAEWHAVRQAHADHQRRQGGRFRPEPL